MSDMLKKAEEAAGILQSAVFEEVFSDLDSECAEAWRAAGTVEERERQHMRQRMLFEVRHGLLDRIGKIADIERKNVTAPEERFWCGLYKTLKEKFT